jgi:hypothetical protein
MRGLFGTRLVPLRVGGLTHYLYLMFIFVAMLHAVGLIVLFFHSKTFLKY